MDAWPSCFIFMGHESAPFGQHDIVAVATPAVLVNANTATPIPSDKTVKTVNMAMELEGLSFALTNSTDNKGAA